MDNITRIVVVDDDASLLFATARILKSAGYEVTTAAGGAEGLEKIREMRPDLVLVDVVMPDIDGPTVCRRIKADPTLCGTYVMLLSSMQTASSQQAEGLESGADGYIARPVEKRELLARVASLLRIKQIQNALNESESRYRLLFQEMISGCALHEMILDPSGIPCDYRFLEINPAFERITGLTREQAIGKRVLEIMPETESLWIERYGRVVLTGEHERFESYSNSFNKHFEVLAYQIRERQFAVTFTDITERKKVEEQLKYNALHDSLTALPNRRLFEDRLDQTIKTTQRLGGQAALLYIDLDGFKPVNDLYGHDAGDIVLRDVAVRIQSCIRTSDTAARIGGDEFVVILQDVAGREDARRVSQKIVDAIRQPFMVSAQECRVGVSIGISLFPDDGNDPKILMKIADQAMYAVKKQRIGKQVQS
ncbi:MAG: response regulator receiver [Syntrophaceae bacterium]|nr:MAG: response regulator receiver [Syntrophaceae bacterium]